MFAGGHSMRVCLISVSKDSIVYNLIYLLLWFVDLIFMVAIALRTPLLH